jgi:hypothetical protein
MVPFKVGVVSSVLVPLVKTAGVPALPTLPLVLALSVTLVMAAVCVGADASSVNVLAALMTRPCAISLVSAA